MPGLALIAVVAAAAVALGVAGTSALRHRRNQRHGPPSLALPHSPVRLLRSEAEVHEAVERALGFEQVIARSVDRRSRPLEENPTRPASLLRLPGESGAP